MHALVVERVGVLAEALAPLVAHVEVPVVLANHHLHGGLERLQDLGAFGELVLLAELGEIAAVEDEVGLRIHRVDVVHGLEDRAHETLVQGFLVEMAVRDVGEPEALFRGVRVHDVHGLEGVGHELAGGIGRRCGHARRLQEVAAVQVEHAVEIGPAPFQVFLEAVFHRDPSFLAGSCSSARVGAPAPCPVNDSMNVTRSCFSWSVSFSGTMPPSRYGFGSPPLS